MVFDETELDRFKVALVYLSKVVAIESRTTDTRRGETGRRQSCCPDLKSHDRQLLPRIPLNFDFLVNILEFFILSFGL